jgi:hypothetical protein
VIRPCAAQEFETIWTIVNDGARAYRGIVPADCLKDPYMAKSELEHEMKDGVVFWGYENSGELIGVDQRQCVLRKCVVLNHSIPPLRSTLRLAGCSFQMTVVINITQACAVCSAGLVAKFNDGMIVRAWNANAIGEFRSWSAKLPNGKELVATASNGTLTHISMAQ